MQLGDTSVAAEVQRCKGAEVSRLLCTSAPLLLQEENNPKYIFNAWELSDNSMLDNLQKAS